MGGDSSGGVVGDGVGGDLVTPLGGRLAMAMEVWVWEVVGAKLST